MGSQHSPAIGCSRRAWCSRASHRRHRRPESAKCDHVCITTARCDGGETQDVPPTRSWRVARAASTGENGVGPERRWPDALHRRPRSHGPPVGRRHEEAPRSRILSRRAGRGNRALPTAEKSSRRGGPGGSTSGIRRRNVGSTCRRRDERDVPGKSRPTAESSPPGPKAAESSASGTRACWDRSAKPASWPVP